MVAEQGTVLATIAACLKYYSTALALLVHALQASSYDAVMLADDDLQMSAADIELVRGSACLGTTEWRSQRAAAARPVIEHRLRCFGAIHMPCHRKPIFLDTGV